MGLECTSIYRPLYRNIPVYDGLNNLTERPVTRKHVGEVGDDVEGGVDDIRHGQVDKEVVGHGAHPLV